MKGVSAVFPTEIQASQIDSFTKNSLVSHLGISFLELSKNQLVATMPVDERTKQPAGLLHGGASVALAETLGSVASDLTIDRSRWAAVGLEINANHIKSAKSGTVKGVCRSLHHGRTTHVWEIKVRNDDGQLVCVCRMTVAIVERKK